MPLHSLNPMRYLACRSWLSAYNGKWLQADLLAAAIVTILLIPQSLAYAILAGLPPEVGLYSSMLPLLLYSLFGSSRTLSVGPVAVVSLMTAVAVGQVAQAGSSGYLEAAIMLAGLSGLILLGMGLFRLGFLANFLSHPVISGFVMASGLIIAASQTKHLLGISAQGHNLPEILLSLGTNLEHLNPPTLLVGLATLAFLLWARNGLAPLLQRLGMKSEAALVFARTGPVWAVLAATAAVSLFGLDQLGVATLGHIPSGLPALALPSWNSALAQTLISSALLISIVGFVESVSVAQTLAAKRRQSIDPDQELLGLGAANIGSAFSGGFPVTGGFSRSVVNFEAGAATPAAGAFAAAGIALATLLITPFLSRLPVAVLAATIIVAVISLIDLKAVANTWSFSKRDAIAMIATLVLTLTLGVELGILGGVGLSLLLYLHRTSRPHTALVGLVPGTEHFRNIDRHRVITCEDLISLRVDASLYFANCRFLENLVASLVASHPRVKHLVLMCPAVNDIDASALDSLELINERLEQAGVKLHLSEVKGPVMDKLQRTDFLQRLTGEVFLTQYQAVAKLSPCMLQDNHKILELTED